VYERVVLAEMTGRRAGRAADEYGVGVIEPAGQAGLSTRSRVIGCPVAVDVGWCLAGCAR
jgi:hypothetical protein